MSKKTDLTIIQMNVEDANKTLCHKMKSANKQPVLLHPIRSRSAASGAMVGGFVLSRLYNARKGRYTGIDAHGVVKAELGIGPKANDKYAAVCFTHGSVCFTQTRPALMHGAIFTSAQDKRSVKAKANCGATATNRDGTLRVPIGWCAGCVSALSASV